MRSTLTSKGNNITCEANAEPFTLSIIKEAAHIKAELASRAHAEGLEAFGVVALPAELRADYYRRWIAEGQHGTMAWMARDPERRLDPQKIAAEARTVLVFGQNYYQPEPERRGRIAKYALGADYHKVVLKKLKRLCRWLQEHGGAQKPYVDTGPILEKPFAALAGLGWQGKNTVVLNPEHGQWLFLGVILTTLELPADKPAVDRCGTCTRCLDICPTRAITAPYQLDSRRCISYLTIEHDGPIPPEFRRAIGDHLFGCDDCLDVCPWNRWAQVTREGKFTPRPYPDLRDMLAWDEATFREIMAGSPMRRTGLRRWKRNVCIVLGNTGTHADLPALTQLLTSEDDLLSEHAQWALDEIASRHEGTPHF